jgi:hypothetical protein
MMGVINETLKRIRGTILDLYAQLKLDATESPFADIAEHTMGECRKDFRIDQIKCHLQSELPVINARAREEGRLLVEYFVSLTQGEPAIAVDIGCYGTMSSGLVQALKRAGTDQKLLNLFSLSHKRSARNLLNGVDIRGFISCILNLGNRMSVLESSMGANIGSTVGYKKRGDKVEPMLDRQNELAKIRLLRDALHDGIFNFQAY